MTVKKRRFRWHKSRCQGRKLQHQEADWMQWVMWSHLWLSAASAASREKRCTALPKPSARCSAGTSGSRGP